MKKFVTIAGLFFICQVGLGNPLSTKIKGLSCVGTAEHPGSPRDLMTLEIQQDNTYRLSYADNSTDSHPQLKVISKSLNCDFSTQNPNLFKCLAVSQDASVQSEIRTSQRFHPIVGVRASSSMSVELSGVGFAKDLPQQVLILDFMFDSNCQVLL